MRVVSQAAEVATEMKSHMKAALRATPAVRVHISMPVQRVLRDVRHAFLGSVHQCRPARAGGDDQGRPRRPVRRQGRPEEGRRAVHGGSTIRPFVLGGQRIAVRRLRARSLQLRELALPTFDWAAAADQLGAAALAIIAAGASPRRYAANS